MQQFKFKFRQNMFGSQISNDSGDQKQINHNHINKILTLLHVQNFIN